MNSRTSAYAHMEWDTHLSHREVSLGSMLKELWDYRFLAWLLIKRDFKMYYKQTLFGPLWHLLQPILSVAVYFLLFTKIVGMKTEGSPPVLFYYTGVVLWNFFSGLLLAVCYTFISNSGMFSKVYFPRLIMPVTNFGGNIIRLGIQLLVLLALFTYWALVKHINFFHWRWFLALIPVAATGLFALAAGLIVAAVSVKYRDVALLVSHSVHVLLYATPVVYPLSIVHNETLRAFLYLNPLTPWMEMFRYCLLGQGTINITMMTVSMLFILLLLFLGIYLFRRAERTFTDII